MTARQTLADVMLSAILTAPHAGPGRGPAGRPACPLWIPSPAGPLPAPPGWALSDCRCAVRGCHAAAWAAVRSWRAEPARSRRGTLAAAILAAAQAVPHAPGCPEPRNPRGGQWWPVCECGAGPACALAERARDRWQLQRRAARLSRRDDPGPGAGP